MPDQDAGTLLIGAKIDTGVLTSDLQLTKEDIATFVESVNVEFSEMSTRTASAMARIGDDTKEAAATISSEWQRAAAASYEFAQAQREVRAATTLVTATEGEDAAAVQILAAAKERAAVAGKELAAANKAVAAADIEETGAAELLSGAMEKLGGVLELALGVGLFEGMISRNKEAIVSMEHLSAVTGLSLGTIAGLRFAAESAGVSFDSLTSGLGRLTAAQETAAQGGKKQTQALADIGLTVAQIKNLSPEEYFFTVANAMANTESPAARAAAAIALFGRGGLALIPMLEKWGTNLQAVTNEHGSHSQAVTDGAKAVSKFDEVSALLSEQWRNAMVPALQLATAALQVFESGWIILNAVVGVTFTEMANSVAAWVGLIENAGQATLSAAKGNFQLAARQIGDGFHAMKDTAKLTADDTTQIWTDAYKQLGEIWKDPAAPKPASEKGANDVGKVDDTRLQQWRLQLDQMRDAEDAFHELSKADEAAFWQSKLAIAQGTPKLYAEVYHQFAEADRAAKQQSLKDEVQAVETSVQQYRQGSQERVAILQEEVNHLHAMGADQTAEYKRLQQQLTTAQREASEQEKAIQVKTEEEKVKETVQGTRAREQAEQAYVDLIKKLYGEDSTQYAAAEAQKTAETQRFIAQQTKMKVDAAKDNEQLELADLQESKDAFEQKIHLGLESNSQILAQELNFAQQEHQIRLNALNQEKASIDPDKDPEAARRIDSQLLQETQRYENQKLQIRRKFATDAIQLEQGIQNAMRSGFSNAISGMITGTQTLAQSMRQLFSGIVNVFASMLSDMLTRWIATNILMKVFGIQDQEEMAASKGSSDAALAAGGTFAWWSGVNPLVAPAMAAAAYAEGMTWAALAATSGSAEHGALLDQDMPIFAHAKEMILPANLSEGIQRMISFGGFRMPSFGSVAAPGSGGGDTHIHNTTNTINNTSGDVNAIDGRGIGAALKSSRSEVVKTLQKFVRSGHMSPRKLGFRS